MIISRNKSSGFTLMEVLVATFILLVLVIILGQVYHQSSVCWSAGVRRAQGNTSGRSAMGYMARELMCAVAEPEYLNDINVQPGSSISFITLANAAGPSERVAQRVQYAVSGGELKRTVQKASASSYGSWSGSDTLTIATNVNSLLVTTSDPSAGTFGDMPAWVNLKLTLSRKEDVSSVGASSMGPDRKEGTADDIISN